MIKKILLILSLMSFSVLAGLPPTTSKKSGDSTNVTTFNFQFPNFTGTRTGTTTSFDLNTVAGGGTGLTTLTANNVILGNGTSAPNFVAPGTNGNCLTSNGTTWVSSACGGSSALIAASYWLSGNFVASATIPINFDTPEIDTNSAVTTSATAWKFTAPSTRIYKITVTAMANSGSYILLLFKNGVQYKKLGWLESASIRSQSTNLSLSASDYIDIRPDVSATILGSGTLPITTTRIDIESL